jgi:hypothetical protein
LVEVVVDCQRVERLNGVATHLLAGTSPLAAEKALCLEAMINMLSYPASRCRRNAYYAVKLQAAQRIGRNSVRSSKLVQKTTEPRSQTFSISNCPKQNMQFKKLIEQQFTKVGMISNRERTPVISRGRR